MASNQFLFLAVVTTLVIPVLDSEYGVEESSSDEEKGEEVTSNVDDKGKGKQVMP
ncbi:uncharacterized protein G2W53_008220 [Senna tora]|uniref:Uncharacterized protein n=1 Tax=Senna tora TaxID=362788 RepID=A0A834X6M6_9FABA|nr:uncharacterized protein G2W53_008220 [Senna tora]